MESSRFRKAVLSNGVTLVAERHPYVRSVSVGVWIKVGSCNESPAVSGISHFIEHMVFKGTQTRSPLEIATVLEGLGGELNAFTERECTCYHATVLTDHTDTALDVLSDLVLRPTFPRSELERERKVLLQEWAMGIQTPEDNIYDMLFREVWKGESLGQSVIGSKRSIQSISRQALEGFFQDHYQPGNLVISVAGNIEFESLRDRCEQFFKTDKVQPPLPLVGPKVTYHSRHILEKVATDQLHCLIGFECCGVRDAKRYEMLFISLILGGGMGSRLFQQVREKAALAYTVDCDYVPFLETGILTIYASMNGGSLSRYLRIVGDELRNLADVTLSDEEFERTKNQLRGMILLSSELMESRQESLARNEFIYGKQFSVEEIIAALDNVTAASIRRVASEIFVPQKESLVVLCKRKPISRKLTVFE